MIAVINVIIAVFTLRSSRGVERMSEHRMQYLREEQERLEFLREERRDLMEELRRELHERLGTMPHLSERPEREDLPAEEAERRQERGAGTRQQEVDDLRQEILRLRQEYARLAEEVEQALTQQREAEQERGRVVEGLRDIRKILEEKSAPPPERRT
jgi:chromosome segregation ATPase